MTEILGYHHLSLSVTDLATSSSWYQQVLGLEVTAEVEGDGFRRVRLRAPYSGVTLTLTSHAEQTGEPFSERRAGMDHVAFWVGGVADVEALRGRFEQLGVVASAVRPSDTGIASMTFRDPDNIQLEVFGGGGA
jgi:glyoxylase I family protein